MVNEFEKMMFNVNFFIPFLYGPLCKLVTISFKLCLFILHAFSMAEVTLQVNRDLRILMQGLSNIWEIVHIVSSMASPFSGSEGCIQLVWDSFLRKQ